MSETSAAEHKRTWREWVADLFSGARPDSTEENLQSRARGNVLMALSNKFEWLVLTTGNKSEMAVGYTTIYGDMAGARRTSRSWACPRRCSTRPPPRHSPIGS